MDPRAAILKARALVEKNKERLKLSRQLEHSLLIESGLGTKTKERHRYISDKSPKCKACGFLIGVVDKNWEGEEIAVEFEGYHYHQRNCLS